MSSFIYPGPSLMPGLTWERERSYVWSTTVQPALSGKESRIAYQQYPRVKFGLNYELLRDDVSPSDLRRLQGLFNALRGRMDTCLFSDPDFHSVTLEPFGVGDGATRAFQLTAQFGNGGGPGVAELIQNLNGAPTLYSSLSHVPISTGDYTLGPTGIITFAAAPAATNPLFWSGSFFYRVRFDKDSLEASQFLNRWWRASVSLISVKL